MTSAFLPTPSLPLARAPPRRARPVCVSRPPKRIAAVAKDLQAALQQSLQARTSRIALRLPAGARLGVEPRAGDEEPASRTRAGDREAARLVAAMFEGTGLAVRVVFQSERLRDAAKAKWGPVESDVVQWGKKREKKKTGGFARAGELEKADVYVVAGGGTALLESVRRFEEGVGMETLVILVNANSDGDGMPVDLEKWGDAFETVYHYEPDPHPKWKGGVLFRKFPDDWVLCRLSPIGTLKDLLVVPDKPSLEAIGEVLGTEQAKAGDGFMKKISTFIGRKS